jgi:predicted enzyme related to lactoylglutathione lyase
MIDKNQGIKQFNYSVKDMAQAKKLYSSLLGVEPYVESPYYTGFRLEHQEIGLVPKGQGANGPVGYFVVSDIKDSLKSLTAAGAQVQQDARDVGGGMLVATLTDADGNVTGLIQMP